MQKIKEEKMEQVEKFARQTQIIGLSEDITDIVLEDGMLQNKSHTIGIVYDEDQLPEKYDWNLTLKATGVDKHNNYKGVSFTKFQFGDDVTKMKNSLLTVCANIYGVDPVKDFTIVSSHSSKGSWPIKVSPDSSETYIMIAPLVDV